MFERIFMERGFACKRKESNFQTTSKFGHCVIRHYDFAATLKIGLDIRPIWNIVTTLNWHPKFVNFLDQFSTSLRRSKLNEILNWFSTSQRLQKLVWNFGHCLTSQWPCCNGVNRSPISINFEIHYQVAEKLKVGRTFWYIFNVAVTSKITTNFYSHCNVLN